MKLKNNEILIRNASLEDAPNLLKWWNDGRVMEHAGFPLGLNTTDNKVIQNIKNHDMINNALLIIEYNKILIGEMNYKKLDHKSVEIGIKICEEEYQNRGLGKIILSL
ncbi:MAG: GNAT family protein, partial [Finegoldia magna]|nr:GNAT family protein [Finegoldia magna]